MALLSRHPQVDIRSLGPPGGVLAGFGSLFLGFPLETLSARVVQAWLAGAVLGSMGKRSRRGAGVAERWVSGGCGAILPVAWRSRPGRRPQGRAEGGGPSRESVMSSTLGSQPQACFQSEPNPSLGPLSRLAPLSCARGPQGNGKLGIIPRLPKADTS